MARAILRYLMANPAARDTVDGLTEWWLLEQRIHETRRQIEDAVFSLVERGFLEATSQADGRLVYSLAGSARADVERLLLEEES